MTGLDGLDEPLELPEGAGHRLEFVLIGLALVGLVLAVAIHVQLTRRQFERLAGQLAATNGRSPQGWVVAPAAPAGTPTMPSWQRSGAPPPRRPA